MTSVNLSLGDRFKNHKTYINRTLWTSYVALPMLAAYFIMGVIMTISRSVNYATIYDQSAEVLTREKIAGVSRILGLPQFGWMLVIGIAIMFALQGFYYVFNSSQIDFYLSQPTTRTQRIRKNYLNAMSTFLVMYVFSEVVALIIAAAMGAVNRYVILSALAETIRALNLFFAFYNITVLAVMLSGTLPIAILLTMGMSFVSMIIVAELDLFKGIFFATYSDIKPFNVHLSPLFDRVAAMNEMTSRNNFYQAVSSFDGFGKCLKLIVPREIDTLIVGIIAFVAVLIISHLRQSEWAGKSIPLRPFRWFVKVIACALVGIGSGYFVYLIYIGVWNKKLYPIMCAIMIVATIFAGCVMEVILEGNIRRFFKGMAQTIVAACLVLLTFIIYRGDLLGFDSYVPDPSKVASCAIIGGNRSFNSYTDTYYSYGTGSDMVLNNVEDVCKIARTGMKLQKELRDSDGRSSTGGYFMTVLYRMKNGRKIYRYIVVPYDSFDEEMERIVSSEEFKRGYFDIFSDDRVREADKATKSHTLRYVSMNSSSDTRNFDYEKVSDAYRKDLLENYTFSYIKESVPIGSIEYENNGTEDYIFGSLDVYDSFTNTIALLQEYGIYQEGTLKASDIKEIRVTNYFVGYDLEENSDADINYDSTKTSSVSYTDEESIEKIIEVSISNSYHNPWFNYDTTNEQFGIEVYLKGNSSSYCDQYYSFIRGKVPDFVKADTKG